MDATNITPPHEVRDGAKKAAKEALAYEGVKAARVVAEGTGETVASYKSA